MPKILQNIDRKVREGVCKRKPCDRLVDLADMAILQVSQWICDRVQRPHLWRVLQRLGIRGDILAAIQSLCIDNQVLINL